MKSYCLLVLLSFISFLFACNNSSEQNGSKDTTSSSVTDTTNALSKTTAGEQNFINYAVPGNTKEIIWLKAGIQHSQNKALKEHAMMMLKDHLQLDSTVKSYLSSHSTLSVPTVDTTNAVDIGNKKGAAWDKAWADKMVNDHSDLLNKLKNSQNEIKDSALLNIVNGTIPVVESHLKMAQDLQAKIK